MGQTGKRPKVRSFSKSGWNVCLTVGGYYRFSSNNSRKNKCLDYSHVMYWMRWGELFLLLSMLNRKTFSGEKTLWISTLFLIDELSSFLSVLPSPLKTATTKSFQHQSMIKNDNFLLTASREMNRNARRPKKANHGKRPCNRMRRREKLNRLKSRAHKAKIFGFF